MPRDLNITVASVCLFWLLRTSIYFKVVKTGKFGSFLSFLFPSILFLTEQDMMGSFKVIPEVRLLRLSYPAAWK